MKRKLIIGIIVTTVIAGLASCAIIGRVERLQYASSLFSGKEQYENFAKVPNMFPVSTVSALKLNPSGPGGTLVPTRKTTSLPETFLHRDSPRSTHKFLEETDTVALLVLSNGQVNYEEYWLTGGRNVQWPSWSVAKSYVSALIGIAIEEDLIGSVSDPISDYLLDLIGSGYEGVSIEDVLQMSSGARWNEDYSDRGSDINRLGRILALGGSLDKFVATIGPDLEPGTYNRYNSADTQVLGQLLVKVTGKSLADYTQEKLWQPLNATNDGYWLIDNKGMEMAFAGFHATARDYAKLGELYRNNGTYNGVQIIPKNWIESSTSSAKPHLKPGENPASNNIFGYGYQWWLLDGDEGEYMAMGVYNQFIYVNPKRGVVIVKLSANSDFGVRDDQSSYRDQETISMLRTLAKATEL